MIRLLIQTLGVAFLTLATSILACEPGKNSETSWNPDNKYVSDRLNRFYSLDSTILTAYKAKELSKAAKLANEYLDLANTYKCNWNYGNAIHDGNRYLGLVSLGNGDPTAAVDYLLKSGKSTGSPQLNTFGPDLDLANALLQAGHVEPVKLYLNDIKKFWEMDRGRIDEWLSAIDQGERPALDRFPPKPSAGEYALVWFTLGWPVLVVAGCFYFRRQHIARKWLFAPAGLVVGYAVLFLANWGFSYVLPSALEIVADNYAFMVTPALIVTGAAGLVVSLLAVLGISWLFTSKEKTREGTPR